MNTTPRNPWAPPDHPGQPLDDDVLDDLDHTEPMNPVWRGTLLLVLAFAVCGFGAGSLCGGWFTVGGLFDGSGNMAFLFLSLPSLTIGGALTWWCLSLMRRVWRRGRRRPEGSSRGA